MKIADATIKIMSEKTQEDIWNIVPLDQHELCCEILELAGLEPKTGKNEYILNAGRYKDCKRVADALERDPRFEKFLVNHGTNRRLFRYKGLNKED